MLIFKCVHRIVDRSISSRYRSVIMKIRNYHPVDESMIVTRCSFKPYEDLRFDRTRDSSYYDLSSMGSKLDFIWWMLKDAKIKVDDMAPSEFLKLYTYLEKHAQKDEELIFKHELSVYHRPFGEYKTLQKWIASIPLTLEIKE